MGADDSLSVALEGWFDSPLNELPEALSTRVKDEFFPFWWDDLSSEQRRSVAAQCDDESDPASRRDRKAGWHFSLHRQALQGEILKWEAALAPTAGDLALKEARLTELRQALAQLERWHRSAQSRDVGTRAPAAEPVPGEVPGYFLVYVAYPRAMALLADRLKATPEELAAWVFYGPKLGGIAAWLNVNELLPPRMFSFDSLEPDSFDFIAPLMACWFRTDDIESFVPTERYITGQALLDRWNKHPSIRAEAFVQAKIAESRLGELHPIFGHGQGTDPSELSYPPISDSLFALSEVEAIEAEDFGLGRAPTKHVSSRGKEKKTPAKDETPEWVLRVQAEAAHRWILVRQSGEVPKKRKMANGLVKWCQEAGVMTVRRSYPTFDNILRQALTPWDPPDHDGNPVAPQSSENMENLEKLRPLQEFPGTRTP